jgi:predicted enzyme related to lactoylglutathione lyase
MDTSQPQDAGAIVWADLTVADADQIRDFYAAVAGWNAQTVNMGVYNDYQMTLPGTGESVAGICHARGVNANLPPQWLVYIKVPDIDQSTERCLDLGGQVLVPPKAMGQYGRYCVIQDPSGAVAALIQPPPTPQR